MRKLLIGAVVGVIGLVAATVALAVTGTQQKYTETFSTSKAGKSAASTFNLTSNDPTGPNGQPNPARTTTIIFPKGTIINYKAVKQCSASDLDFQNKGASACPSNTKIGSGTASANTGFPPPITEIGAQVTAFNAKKALILYIVPNNGASNPFVIRALLQGGKTTPKLFTKVPPNCIPPGSPNTNPPCGGKEAPLDSFKLTTNKKGTTKSPYLKTPPCGKSKKWTFTAKLTYRDDPPKTLTSTQKCKS